MMRKGSSYVRLIAGLTGSLGSGLVAQVGPLNPTASTVIHVPAGGLHYSSINIPAGVVVNFMEIGGAGVLPAVIRCDGDAVVDGTLSASAELLRGIGIPGGSGLVGEGLGGWTCNYDPQLLAPPTGGFHVGVYGAALPFDLRGGSRGGRLVVYDSGCFFYLHTDPGAFGGGTIALHANGRIDVRGVVTADGASGGLHTGGGSGGSILLRGDQGVTIHPGASVSAIGLVNPLSQIPSGTGAPGIIRIDSWASPPVLLGTIDPPPTVLTLPHLHVPSPPQLGSPWRLDVLAPEGAPTFVAVSLVPTAGTQTPFGILSIDLTLAAVLGVAIPQPSHDPMASVTMPIPNAPAFLALPLAAQALVVPQTLAPRLTNAVATAIQ